MQAEVLYEKSFKDFSIRAHMEENMSSKYLLHEWRENNFVIALLASISFCEVDDARRDKHKIQRKICVIPLRRCVRVEHRANVEAVHDEVRKTKHQHIRSQLSLLKSIKVPHGKHIQILKFFLGWTDYYSSYFPFSFMLLLSKHCWVSHISFFWWFW